MKISRDSQKEEGKEGTLPNFRLASRDVTLLIEYNPRNDW